MRGGTIIRRRATLLGAAFLLAATAITALGTGNAAAQPAACPDNMTRYSALAHGKPLTCTCLASQFRGSVWGDRRYTLDSSVCRAALHAGAVPAGGGEITVYKAPGCNAFAGSSKNGVTTGKWGPYRESFVFAWPAAACAGAAPTALCPRNMTAFRAQPVGQKLTCRCTPQRFGGSVWGSMRYTTDSSTCGAALHAGAIPGTGGTVTIRTADGCRRFTGSTKNGITTKSWGSYNRTFYFGTQTPPCAR